LVMEDFGIKKRERLFGEYARKSSDHESLSI